MATTPVSTCGQVVRSCLFRSRLTLYDTGLVTEWRRRYFLQRYHPREPQKRQRDEPGQNERYRKPLEGLRHVGQLQLLPDACHDNEREAERDGVDDLILHVEAADLELS